MGPEAAVRLPFEAQKLPDRASRHIAVTALPAHPSSNCPPSGSFELGAVSRAVVGVAITALVAVVDGDARE